MRNWFRGLKLNQKFTVTTLIFIFIPLFGMMCFGFRSIKKNAIDHGVNEAVTAIDLTCAEVNAKANACSMVVDTLQEYEPLEKYLLHLRRGEEISESYYQQFRNNSISIIDKMQEAMPDLYQIHIFAMADGFLEQQPILYQKEKMKNCAWYRSYQGGGQWFFDIQEKNIISGTKKEGSHLMTYVRELRDQSGGRLGVIEVSMRMADIFPEIYRSGDSSWACFVDENWNLYDCGKTAAACKWQSYRGLILFRAGIRDRKESQQSAVIDRKNVAIVLRKVDKLNGMFVTLTNLDDATGNMIKQQQRMLLEFAGFGLLLIVVVNLIVRGLLKEFYDVLCEMRQIDNGTTKIKVCYSAEEMREMSYGINGMLERIQKQNEESIKREAALKDTAIRAMQNQINAHFIYNVLESIKMMAEIDEEYTISDAVTALGEMLHYNMRWNKFLVTVQDEMNYIQNYVELMNLRYDFTITLSVQIPENLSQQSAVIDRKNVAIVLRKVDKLNGMFVTLTNLDDATGNMIKQQQRMLLEFAGFGLLLIVVVNLIVRGLLKEFYDVLCEMRQIDNGTTKIKVCYSAEEMREMSYGINGMLERIQKQNEESIKREAALKDTAIRAMQNQINAHFIYNVLESIKMMAEIDEEYTISDAVTALGEMLHYNMRWNKFLVTVQDEMNYIQNYVELMNLRYDFTITLSVQIPENLYRQDIPKMSLQPIVENAITHGIEELDADAVIEIKGIEHEKSFEIEITDSGIGMSEKQLAILRRKLRMRLNSDTQPKHGIGLRNVQDRIHIQFGTEYGLSVYTKEHCYTKVSIHLPITRGKYSPMDQEGDEKEEEKENEYTAGCRR